MRALFSGSIRKSLIFIVSLSLLPALAVIFFSGLAERRRAMEDTQREALAAAAQIGDIQERITTFTHKLLDLLTRLPAVREKRLEETGELLASIVRENPLYVNLHLVNATGDSVASALGLPPINIADMAHFQGVSRGLEFAPGEYSTSRTTGAPMFPFAHALTDGEGRFAGALSVALGLKHYANFFDMARFPPGSILGVTDANGVRLLHYPPRELTNPLGRRIAPAVWEAMSGDRSSGVTRQKGSDGVERFYAFRQMRLNASDRPYMYMVVGIPVEQALRAADRAMLANAGYLSLAAALALATALAAARFSLNRGFNHLMAAARRLGSGDLAARTGLGPGQGELGQLGHAFDSMAASLERDFEERRRLEAELTTLATTDPLTGAGNRRRFLERLGEEIARSARYERPLALLVLDVDHFKNVNDTHGHDAGDDVLKALAAACQASLRGADAFGRLGGEEFGVLLAETGPEAALAAAERMRRELAAIEVQNASGPVRFTVSIGVASFDPAADSLKTLMKRADTALYEAKNAGRDRVARA
jgi:diguanylate cyclase (GGDEF)-like protein